MSVEYSSHFTVSLTILTLVICSPLGLMILRRYLFAATTITKYSHFPNVAGFFDYLTFMVKKRPFLDAVRIGLPLSDFF